MTYLQEKTLDTPGLHTHIVKTEKFKTVTILFKVLAPLSKDDVTMRSLFPHVLLRGTEKMPKTGELRAYFDELYGATVSADMAKKGENHIITFRLEMANEKYLKDQTPLLEKGIALLSDLLFHPYVENGAFSQLYVDQEKRTLKQRIQAVYDDKMRYSNLRLVQEMCKGEPYALHVNGEMEDIETITAQSLFEAYKHALQTNQLDLYVVGDVEEQDISRMVSQYFKTSDREPVKQHAESTSTQREAKEVIDEEDVKQGKLNIGFRTHTTIADGDYPALHLFNGIFGGFSHSKLFINVREKASLAYYAVSRLESFKGLMMVMSGIEVGNYQQAVDIIKEQFEAMQKGDFSDEAIDQTKAVVKNQLLETIDTSYGTAEYLYQHAVVPTGETLDSFLEALDRVTKEDIIKVGQKIEWDTTYFLKGTEGAS
ncbi:EF-P 5-aminopentanol modification-associated protein YfmF [Bacillus pumilus]|uniref:EF-P 5-aminopentanol modification-associated protein YfmF n=1 Tax=Bacillus pumilus TaxID=1408 RepID=UPI0007EEEB5F|nr:pitrilysin family protein [Bacillus pumilus]MBU8573307.1 insulinase family protein [Bacillus pumilus]OBS87345.1 zinc protease [Bacillus pumilus]